MGLIFSCIASIFEAIGAALMAVVNGIGSILQAIISGIVALFDIIISCLTCGSMGRRSSAATTTSMV
ncbi:hypothetical protein V1505DRAFT_402264 [Lipomyces doorenjongii]